MVSSRLSCVFPSIPPLLLTSSLPFPQALFFNILHTTHRCQFLSSSTYFKYMSIYIYIHTGCQKNIYIHTQQLYTIHQSLNIFKYHRREEEKKVNQNKMLTASPLSGQYFCNWVAEEYSCPFEQFDNFNGYLCRETTPTPTPATTTTTTATSGAAAAASFIQNHHLKDSPSSGNNNLLHHQQAAALLFSNDDIIDDDDDDDAEDNENDNDSSSKNSTVRKTKTTTKKLNHNASERDRRRRINSLYASLRSLLPPQDQAKKLSIPATVSRVLKYIPEIQKQVDNLIHRKETLISRTRSNNNITNSRPGKQSLSAASKSGLIVNNPHRKPIQQQQQASSLLSFSANTINLNDNKEMIVQWSVGMPASESSEDPMAAKAKSAALLLISEVTQCLEDEGFLVINASCVQPFKRNMLFCNMHLQAQGDQMMDAEMLKEKILSLCVK